MSHNTALTQAAQTTMALFCRLSCGEALTEDEMKNISGASVLELYDVRLIDLPIELVGMEFTDPDGDPIQPDPRSAPVNRVALKACFVKKREANVERR